MFTAYLLLAIAHPGRMPDQQSLTVSAAASLTDAFHRIAQRFEAANPKVKVVLNFGGSQQLAGQINQGAPVDVFASASAKNAGQIKYDPNSWRVFALNRLEIVTRKGLTGVRSVRDLASVKTLVLAAEAVPAGHYSEIFFDKASKLYGNVWLSSVRSHVVSKEVDVRAVLSKVRLGEADAGIVYVSDAVSAKNEVQTVAIPDDLNTIARYPLVIPAEAPNKQAAKDFSKFVFSSEAQGDLEAAGFVSPLRPSTRLVITWQNKKFLLPLPLASASQKVVYKLKDHGGVLRTFKGVPVLDLLNQSGWTSATFGCADDYRKTLSFADLKASKAILTDQGDGNYRLIVPGHKFDTWVMWIRSIELG